MEECVGIYLELFRSEPFSYTWLTKETALRYFSDLIKHPRFQGYVFYENGCLLGGCLGYTDDYFLAAQYEIKEIFIDVKRQNGGLGSAFIKEIENDLIIKGIQFVTLLTQRSINAFNFYLKNGYETSEDTVFLSKRLSSPD